MLLSQQWLSPKLSPKLKAVEFKDVNLHGMNAYIDDLFFWKYSTHNMLLLLKCFFFPLELFIVYLWQHSSKNRDRNLISMFSRVKIELLPSVKVLIQSFSREMDYHWKCMTTFSGNKNNEADRTKVMTSSSIISAENN